MTESERVALLRRAYDAFNRGELDTFMDLLDEQVELRPPPSSVEPQPLRGRAEVREYLAPNMFESQTAEPQDVLEEGDRILVVAHVVARGVEAGSRSTAPPSTCGRLPVSGPFASRCTWSGSRRWRRYDEVDSVPGMRVAIAGGHGKIALRLAKLLSERGDEVLSLIRNPDQEGDVRAAGGEPVVCDLESAGVDDVAEALDDADALVFAAGAGPGSGPERKETMDYGGAVKLIEAAKARGISRYVMVSAISADPERPGDDTYDVYARAKGRADADLERSGLDYTIVRPGGLTNDAGTGMVSLGEQVGRGQIPREDVAAVLAAALREPATVGKTFELVAGDTPVDEAVRA